MFVQAPIVFDDGSSSNNKTKCNDGTKLTAMVSDHKRLILEHRATLDAHHDRLEILKKKLATGPLLPSWAWGGLPPGSTSTAASRRRPPRSLGVSRT